ncbi:MAG: asparagine synthase-related protein [Verrucomicrobiales bacterium]|nr:asparagine synthase-related protein [Verrucomicrobiales bacterium]
MPVSPPPESDCLQPRYSADSISGDAERIEELLAQMPPRRRRFSDCGVEAFRSGNVEEHSTCFEQIRRSFPLGGDSEPTGDPLPLKSALTSALLTHLHNSENPVIALSGGIDSFLLACLLREILGHPPRVATLASHLTGYCEGDVTLRLAERLGLGEVEVFEVSEESFVANLPSVISACEVPLYNLHPVSKWLFAREIQKRGYTSCITGDGADQIAAGRIAYDYLPLLSPLFKDQGIEPVCPFLSPPVIESIQSRGADPDKQVIRELAMGYLPDDFMHQPKRPCFTPPMDISGYEGTKNRLSDRENTFRVTLKLLEQSHLKEEEACALSPE